VEESHAQIYAIGFRTSDTNLALLQCSDFPVSDIARDGKYHRLCV
jgi:hypothetical protein